MISSHIVVGVDGSPAARAALHWAADECRIRRRTLVIVHATDPGDALVVGRQSRATFRSPDDVGEYVLRDHAAAASARQPSVAVTTRLSHAAPADVLTDLSSQADLVVVGSSGHGGVVSSVLGSVSDRVAAHAHCPVALVPRRLALRPDSSRVVVGVSPTVSGRLALEFALEEARLRDATLVAVSAIRDPQSEPSSTLDARARRGGALLLDELGAAAASYPDVIIEPTLADSEPAAALLHAAYGAQLVVVGCHHSDDRWSTRLGPVPSAIAHRAPCPVVVVGQRPHAPVEAAGMFATDFA